MPSPPIQLDDRERVKALGRYHILGTPAEPAFDSLTRLTAQIFDAPLALLVLVSGSGFFVKSVEGHLGKTPPRTEPFCSQVIATNAPLFIEDAKTDPKYAASPLVSEPPHFRSFAGHPLRTSEGLTIGVIGAFGHDLRLAETRSMELLTTVSLQASAVLELRRRERHPSSEREGSVCPPEVHSSWLVGNSAAMRRLHQGIVQVAQGDWTVLIEGETGAGKELVAHAIHRTSARRNGRFVPVNCAGLTDSIASSQLFGHVKGSFTGAVIDQVGLFEAANGGTLFLDEIGDVSLPIQCTLLRVLQEKEITRLGETQARKVDVRILTATNRSLRRLVTANLFREDLLYRVRSTRIHVPPLRDHREDIPQLVATFLAQEMPKDEVFHPTVTPEAMQCLMSYHWPGNVRELRGAISHAVSNTCTGQIEVDDLPLECVTGKSQAYAPRELVTPTEHARILQALERAGGNKVKAARLLGVARATLYRRLRELGIDPSTGEER